MTQFGMYAQTTPRNDASPGRGQWNPDTAYRYISEAYGGYHLNALNGINVNADIFMSYVGLFSYYQFDNWAYQPSYVSSNTPWFFNGIRIQVFPTQVEDRALDCQWLAVVREIQQGAWFRIASPISTDGWLSVLGNQYFGTDTLGIPGRSASTPTIVCRSNITTIRRAGSTKPR